TAGWRSTTIPPRAPCAVSRLAARIICLPFRCRRPPCRCTLLIDRKRQAQRPQPAALSRTRARPHRRSSGAPHRRTPALELATARRQPRCRLSQPPPRTLTVLAHSGDRLLSEPMPALNLVGGNRSSCPRLCENSGV